MKIYFDNDGSYDQGAINTPILVNGKPIGFISGVTEEYVTCYLFDMFIDIKMKFADVIKKEKKICSIAINNDSKI